MEEASPVSNVFRESSTQSEQPKKRSWKKAVVLILVLVLLGFGGYKAMAYFLGSGESQQQEVIITPTPTIEEAIEEPTETPIPEESPTPEVTKSPTARPTTSPIDKATGIDRRELSIEVQNGSGEKGVAGKVSEYLKSFGYKIGGTKNADNFDYTNVTISIKSASENYLSLLKKDLNTEYTVGDTNSTLSASSSADVVVIIGK